MVQNLIDQANEIVKTNDGTKFQGALIQVCEKLSVDECEQLFIEVGGNTLNRHLRSVERVRTNVDPKIFNIHGLRHTAVLTIESYMVYQSRMTV